MKKLKTFVQMLRVADEEKEGPNRYCGGIYQLRVEVIYMKFFFLMRCSRSL